MTATTMLVLPVVVAQAFVAPVFLRYHCWLNMGSLGMSPGGGGGGVGPCGRMVGRGVPTAPPAGATAPPSLGALGTARPAGGWIAITPFGSTASTVPRA